VEGQALAQKIINWAVELNGYTNITPPAAEVDAERRAAFDQVMSVVDHGIAVSRDALYDRCGLPRPRGDGDAFVKQEPAGFALSDAGGKKKPPVKKPRPAMRIM
jgi:hypothetical protein